MSNHIQVGKKGEELAKEYLLEKGYELLTTNYRFQHLEIDLLFLFENTLIVVEVKSRQTAELGEPYEAVTRQKQRQIIKATNHYIIEENMDKEVRFDIVSIHFYPDNSFRLEHIEDAFTA